MSEKSYKTLKNPSSAVITVKRSEFIASACSVSDEKEASDFILSVKKKYSDARHNVSAYLLCNGAMRSNDDGEPSGTGGMPVLGAIKNSGLENIAIVVTRYFGGILLGAPGLTRAYSSAAENAIKNGEKVIFGSYTDFKIECSYTDYNKIKYLLDKAKAKYGDTDFSDNVKLNAALPTEDYISLINETFIKENIGVVIEEIGTHFDAF